MFKFLFALFLTLQASVVSAKTLIWDNRTTDRLETSCPITDPNYQIFTTPRYMVVGNLKAGDVIVAFAKQHVTNDMSLTIEVAQELIVVSGWWPNTDNSYTSQQIDTLDGLGVTPAGGATGGMHYAAFTQSGSLTLTQDVPSAVVMHRVRCRTSAVKPDERWKNRAAMPVGYGSMSVLVFR